MKVLVFDTETDGLIANVARKLQNQPKLIEFFGLELEQNGTEFAETGHWHQLVQSERVIPDKITQITGITKETLLQAPIFSFLAERFEAYLSSFDLVVAHNLGYDRDIMDFELARVGRKVKWPKGLCTVEATEWVKGHRLSLTALHEHLFGEPFSGAHRAEEDVRALARCYMELVKQGMM